MLNRSKFWAVGLLFAAFVAGIAVGGVVSAAWGENDGADRDRRGRRMGYAERLQSELSFSPAQRESVNVILDRRQAEMRQLWGEMSPRFDTLRLRIRGEIMALLDEAQRTRFEELIAISDSTRAARRNHRGERGK